MVCEPKEVVKMRIAIGLDLHAKKAVAHAVYAGNGVLTERHASFLEGFNGEFAEFGSKPEDMARMAMALRGHEAHVLIENSTKTHETYWVLVANGIDAVVAVANDLYRITKSNKKTDVNDAMELAGYMRRRLHGETEFSTCTMPPREWMMKREICRTIFYEKRHLANLKRRVRMHMLLHGIVLSREYSDIFCKAAIAEMKRTRDPCLLIPIAEAEGIKKRTLEEGKLITMMFANDRTYELIRSIPGFGAVSAAYMASMIMDIGRFPRKNGFTAYFGIVPRVRQSADSSPGCATTHRGDEDARRIICQSAMVHVRTVEDSIVTAMYNRLRGRGMAHKEALVACGRKLMTVVWSVLRNDRPYVSDPGLLAAAAEEEERVEEEMSGE